MKISPGPTDSDLTRKTVVHVWRRRECHKYAGVEAQAKTRRHSPGTSDNCDGISHEVHMDVIHMNQEILQTCCTRKTPALPPPQREKPARKGCGLKPRHESSLLESICHMAKSHMILTSTYDARFGKHFPSHGSGLHKFLACSRQY